MPRYSTGKGGSYYSNRRRATAADNMDPGKVRQQEEVLRAEKNDPAPVRWKGGGSLFEWRDPHQRRNQKPNEPMEPNGATVPNKYQTGFQGSSALPDAQPKKSPKTAGGVLMQQNTQPKVTPPNAMGSNGEIVPPPSQATSPATGVVPPSAQPAPGQDKPPTGIQASMGTSDFGQALMRPNEPTVTMGNDSAEVDALRQAALETQDPAEAKAYVDFMAKKGMDIPWTLQAKVEAGLLTKDAAPTQQLSANTPPGTASRGRITAELSPEMQKNVDAAQRDPVKSGVMRTDFGGESITAKAGFHKDPEKVRSMEEQARRGGSNVALPEPENIYEKYADQIIQEAIDGRRDANDPAVVAAMKIRPTSSANLHDRTKEIRDNAPGGMIIPQDGGHPVPIDYYLNRRAEQRAQDEADRTGESQNLPGRGGNLATGFETARQIRPSKPTDESAFSTPMRTPLKKEQDRVAKPYVERGREMQKELRDIGKEIRGLTRQSSKSAEDNTRLKELRKQESALKREKKANKRNLTSVHKDFDQRAKDVLAKEKSSNVRLTLRDLANRKSRKKKLSDIARHTEVRDRGPLGDRGLAEVDLAFKSLGKNPDPELVARLYYQAAGAEDAKYSPELTTISNFARLIKRDGMTDHQAITDAAKIIFGDPQKRIAIASGKARAAAQKKAETTNEKVVAKLLENATPEQAREIHNRLGNDPRYKDTPTMRAIGAAQQLGIELGDTEDAKPVVSITKLYSLGHDNIYGTDETLPYDHIDRIIKNLWHLGDQVKNLDAVTIEKLNTEENRRKSLFKEYERFFDLGRKAGRSGNEISRLWEYLIASKGDEQVRGDWEAVNPNRGSQPKPLPPDPSQWEVGEIYVNATGQAGRWNGQTFEVQ